MLTASFFEKSVSSAILTLLRYHVAINGGEAKRVRDSRSTLSTISRFYTSVESHMTDGDKKNVQRYLARSAVRRKPIATIEAIPLGAVLPNISDKDPKQPDEETKYEWHNAIAMSSEASVNYLNTLIRLDKWFFSLQHLADAFFRLESSVVIYRVYSAFEILNRYRADMIIGDYSLDHYYVSLREFHEMFMSPGFVCDQAKCDVTGSKRTSPEQCEKDLAEFRRLQTLISDRRWTNGVKEIQKTFEDLLKGEAQDVSEILNIFQSKGVPQSQGLPTDSKD